ncbi:hypothetical protein Acr_07g0010890 [Actinidia rufa]|uniref:Uncharacterized protein n=1 Tax=Actinidia rufa TaxID=165716 RepID=A0A7J0EWX1_9ERIC|nr:hypothetical protein Acr_07g0010890 [Actinidia rufa]
MAIIQGEVEEDPTWEEYLGTLVFQGFRGHGAPQLEFKLGGLVGSTVAPRPQIGCYVEENYPKEASPTCERIQGCRDEQTGARPGNLEAFPRIGEAVDGLEKMKEDCDVTVARLEVEVAELKKNEALAKKRAIEEFKFSDDFQEPVELTASKYFGMGIDLDLLDEEDDAEEEREEKVEEKEEEENEEVEGDQNNTLSP